MTAFLIDHLSGCTPLSPCASCEGARFLRGKLSEEDFNTLVQMVGGSNKPPLSFCKNPRQTMKIVAKIITTSAKTKYLCLFFSWVMVIAIYQ